MSPFVIGLLRSEALKTAAAPQLSEGFVGVALDLGMSMPVALGLEANSDRYVDKVGPACCGVLHLFTAS